MTDNTAAAAGTSQPLRAVAIMMVGVALLNLNEALVKSLTGDYPVGQILFIRAAFVVPWVLLLAYCAGGAHTLKVKRLSGQLLRASCVLASAFLLVSGLAYLPLADTIAVTFAGPLFVTALAPFFLGERVGWRRALAVCAGFIGVLIIIRPGSETIQWAVLFPLGAAFSGAVRDLVTRSICQSESSVAVLFVTTMVVLIASAFTYFLGWEPLATEHITIFAMSGILIAGSHYLIIESFRQGEAALVAPFKYSAILWAIIFGYLFFGDLPDLWTIAGALIVISAGLYILQRELDARESMR